MNHEMLPLYRSKFGPPMIRFRNCSVANSAGSALGLEQLTKLWSQYGSGWLYFKKGDGKSGNQLLLKI